MNEINTEASPTNVSNLGPQMGAPKSSGPSRMYWAVVLAAMGICLAVAMFYVYKRNMPVQTKTQIVKTAPKSEVAPAEQDKTKTPDQVTTETINQIDELNKTDLTGPLGNDPTTDLQ